MSKKASILTLAVSLSVIGLVAPTAAHADLGAAPRARATTPERVQPLLADVVVNGSPQSPPAAAPAPAPVVVAPQPAAAPVVEPSRSTTVVEHESPNYMSTIALSAVMGGVVGVLVGGSIYFLSDNQTHAGRIAYWGAGGVLVGTAVGLTQIAVQESRVDRATAEHLPTDPAPTFRLALFQRQF